VEVLNTIPSVDVKVTDLQAIYSFYGK
jgi:hypothetical protein